jgi:ABC-2 type transport system ATP-binding protein
LWPKSTTDRCGTDEEFATLNLMISAEHVTKSYGEYIAVNDVSFECAPGTITGFLGPNGAGKSTTMRVMVGLTPATSGRVTFSGRLYRDIPNPGRQVGILLDASAQHAGRTGREVLNIGAMTMGLPGARVDEMLAMVGLTDAESRRRVRDYSLGMKQRLGIAHALLGDPGILILDEPVNGLDPAGIRWMRSLLRWHADRGGTVLLSSHLLHEVELIADQVILIGAGRVLANGTSDELLARSGGAATIARPEDPTAFAGALTAARIAFRSDGLDLHVFAPPIEVGRLAAREQHVLIELRARQGGLEELFLELTAADERRTSKPFTAATTATGATR